MLLGSLPFWSAKTPKLRIKLIFSRDYRMLGKSFLTSTLLKATKIYLLKKAKIFKR